jgi:hypothetical protein
MSGEVGACSIGHAQPDRQHRRYRERCGNICGGQTSKSFISLDDAYHLVSKKDDAEYAASVLASWASRYIPAHEASDDAGTPAGEVVVAETGENPFAQAISAGVHNLCQTSRSRSAAGTPDPRL